MSAKQNAMSNFFSKVNNIESYQKIFENTRDKNIITAFGVQNAEKPFVASGLSQFVLYVSTDYIESQRTLRTINAISDRNAVYIPHKEDVLLYKNNYSKESIYARNKALSDILSGNTGCAVVCLEALLQFLPDVQTFLQDSFSIEVGVCYSTDMVASGLVQSGYSRVESISAVGEFTLHGDILDVNTPSGRYRTSFWGDEVEEISKIDGESKAKVQSFSIMPLYDMTGVSGDEIAKVAQMANRIKASQNAKARLNEIISELELSASSGKSNNAWLTPFAKTSTIFDYLPENSIVVFDEPKLIESRIAFLLKEHNVRVANLLEAGEILPIHEQLLMNGEKLCDTSLHILALQTLAYQSWLIKPQEIFNFKTSASPVYRQGEEQLAKDISNWLQNGYQVVLFAGDEKTAEIKDKLANSGAYLIDDGKLEQGKADGLILPTAIEHGFVSHTNKLAVIGTRDIGRGMSSGGLHKDKKQAFLSVEKGDYVVHDFHGIGLCEGIQKITTADGECKDYIVVLYKGGDHLYVPVDSTNLLSRYSGGENPTLSRLGGGDFAKVKEKVKSGIKEMSINLLKLYAEREKARGFAYKIDSYLDEEFEASFPYRPTPDQLKCMEEIKGDLTRNKIMDRVLVGDVGYGKTEVAMRTAFDVVSNGYQVAVLAPTTILSEQHFETFNERMQNFDIRVACLNRFRSKEEQNKIVEDIANGKIDIIIGTHRLLSKDVKFNKLGLLVLDEEQRFGVEHKEKIKEVKTSVDVLTLSATPIPRTLHMALSGIRDISTITTPPVDRLPVETFVAEANDALIRDVISREISRDGQVFFVYNKVQNIDNFAGNLRSLVPEAKICVAHGQMNEQMLEDVIMSFKNGDYNVLVCSTIIENGIDIPRANTIIVYDADTLGLSQLYQLRGRVGRSSRLAYAYFLYQQDKVLSEVAYKRLSSITEYSELGSGFKIAMKDLEIRGAGNILGREQHGHMVKVGYDMYARLLQDAVAELKGEEVKQETNVELEMDINAYAPDDYIASQKERIEFYQQLASCKTLGEVANIQKQIEEIYGVMPKPMENLFEVCTFKVLAGMAGVRKVVVHPGHGELVFNSKEDMMRKCVFDMLCEDSRASASTNGYSIVFNSPDYMQKSRLLAHLKEFLVNIEKKPD